MTEDMEEKQMMDEFEEKACKSKEPSPKDKERIEEIKKVIVENSECIPSEMSELVDTLIASIRAEAYERGFIDGANLTGSQALEELKEQKQYQILLNIASTGTSEELFNYIHSIELEAKKEAKQEFEQKLNQAIIELREKIIKN